MYRNQYRPLLRLVVVVGVVFACFQQVCQADLLGEYRVLDKKLEALGEEYGKKIDAITKRDPDFDPKTAAPGQLPEDGRPALLKTVDALLEAHPNDPGLVSAAIQAIHRSLECGDPAAAERFDSYVPYFAGGTEIEDELELLEYYYADAGDPFVWIDAFHRLGEVAKKRRIKRGATLVAAKIQMDIGRLAPARKAMKAIIMDAPYADIAKRAKGFIYEIDHLQVGMSAPDIEATKVEGGKISLDSLRGKVVLIDFWATWCPSCIAEVPQLKKAVERFKGQFEILSISCDDDRGALKSMLRNQPLPGIHTWDQKDGQNPIAKTYNVQGFPTWYLLDAEGVIRAKDPLGKELIPAIEQALRPPTGTASEG